MSQSFDMVIKHQFNNPIIVVIESGDSLRVAHLSANQYGTHEEAAILNFMGPNGTEVEIIYPKRLWGAFLKSLIASATISPQYGGIIKIGP